MFIFASIIFFSFITLGVKDVLSLPSDLINKSTLLTVTVTPKYHISYSSLSETVGNDSENVIFQEASTVKSSIPNKSDDKYLVTSLSVASLNKTASSTIPSKASKLAATTPVNDIKTSSTFDWRPYASIASKWINFSEYSEVTEDVTTESTTEFSTLYETTYDMLDVTQLLNEIVVKPGKEENIIGAEIISEFTEKNTSTLTNSEITSTEETSEFTENNDETTISVTDGSFMALDEINNQTIKENVTSSTTKATSFAVQFIRSKLNQTQNSNVKQVLIGTDEISHLVTQADDNVPISTTTIKSTSQTTLKPMVSTVEIVTTLLTSTDVPTSEFTKQESSSIDITSESMSTVAELSTSTLATTEFAAKTFNWRTFLPTNMFKPTSGPMTSTESTNDPFNQRHRYDMPEKNNKRISSQSIMSIITITVTVAVACILLSIFAIQRYRNQQLLDGSSVALMSSRRDRARTYYYDTSI